MHRFHHIFIQILLLLATLFSVTVIAIAKLRKEPDSIALVLVGLVLGLTELPIIEDAERYITQSEVFQATFISLFLPILLGDATLKLPFHHLFSQKKTVIGLAFVGTFVSSICIGTAAYFLLDLPLAVAFVFAALMSATDPISVLSIFKSLGVQQKVSTVIEGESLFNDGMAVVLFDCRIYLQTYMEMGWAGIGSGVFMFLKFAIGGAIVGLILGYFFSQVIRVFDDYPLEVAVRLQNDH
nr:Na+/H+ antiporter [uncultured bacterium]